MTPRQTMLVQKSFAQVTPIAEQAAALFYGRLFEIAPHLRALFHGDMQAQGVKLMAAMKMVVDGLGAIDTIAPAVQTLAKRHIGYGVRAEHYDTVGTALLWTLEQGLGAAFPISATQTTVTLAASAAVAAIDVDVAVSQVAGPDRPMAAANAEINGEANVAAGHVARHRSFIISRNWAAVCGDGNAADGDRQPVAVRPLAGLADGHDDATPIGVTGGDRGLDQWRIADDKAHPLREINEHLVERAAESPERGIGSARDPLVSGLAGRDQQQRIARRRIAVDGDRVERAVIAGGENRLECGRGDIRVGKDVRQHRAHVRRDHAGALRDAVDRDERPADLDATCRTLGKGVGRHDRLGRLGPESRAGGSRRCRQGGDDLLRGERLANDARRRDEYFTRIAPEYSGRRSHRLAHGVAAALTGKDVGVTRIDHDRPRLAALQCLAAPIDRRPGR